MKLHQKGYLLVELSQFDSLWDYTLISLACAEYKLSANNSQHAVSIALDELAAAGLISIVEEKLVQWHGKDILSFCYQLSPFGKQRMQDTGLFE